MVYFTQTGCVLSNESMYDYAQINTQHVDSFNQKIKQA